MRRRATGFTLIEMMVTIVILGVLLALAVPSYKNTIVSTRMSSEINELQTSLNFARSEAVKRGLPIVVCPLNGTVCSTSNPLDWSGGWAVLDTSTPTPTKLRLSPPLTHGDTLISNSSASPTFSPAGYTFFSIPIKLHDSNSTSDLYRCVTFNTGSWKTQQGAAPCS